ncbi:diaminopimelate decarboxylase [Candidatus Vidania fulgoroideorum]
MIIKKIINKYSDRPVFIYNKNKILKNLKLYKKKRVKTFYAIKANYNKEIIKIIKNHTKGFEVVSVGEIKKLLKIKADCKNIIFSGVCKTKQDILYAKKKNIGYISVESYKELKTIIKIYKKVKIILKLNLNIKPKTNKNIITGKQDNKFGIPKGEFKKIIKLLIKKNQKIFCLGFHLGSQISSSKPYIQAIKKITKIYNKIKKQIKIKNIFNIGGGFGVNYKTHSSCGVFKKIYNFITKKKINVLIEPGRSIIANTCVTAAKIVYIKKTKNKNFLILNIGMESLLRIALYNSKHKIKTLNRTKNNKKKYDVVGPICESTDIIKKNASLSVKKNDYIVIFDTGAYCLSMRMNYNLRKKPYEVIYCKKKFKKI